MFTTTETRAILEDLQSFLDICVDVDNDKIVPRAKLIEYEKLLARQDRAQLKVFTITGVFSAHGEVKHSNIFYFIVHVADATIPLWFYEKYIDQVERTCGDWIKYVRDQPMSRRFIVASSSPHKLAAATSALRQFGSVAATLATVTTSIVQPVGVQQALACARERLACVARANVDGDDAIIVAIESYLLITDSAAVDTCVALIGADEYSYAYTDNGSGPGVRVPAMFVPSIITPEWQQRTIGARIAAAIDMPAVATDWYRTVNKNNQSRAVVMALPVPRAFEEFMNKKKLQATMVTYQDFPTAGVAFNDIFATLATRNGSDLMNMLRWRVQEHVSIVAPYIPYFIVGLESRGMMLGLALAALLHCPFVPARKPGKLPGAVERVEYTKEYGTDAFEMQRAYMTGLPETAIVVDDVLATGGSMAAACELVERMGKRVGLVLALVDIKPLRAQWQAKLAKYTVALAL